MLLAFGVALAAGSTVAWLVVRFGASIGLLDVPNERSSHRQAVPRAGGAGIVAGVGAGTIVLFLTGHPLGRGTLVLLIAAAAIAAIGAVDDFRSLPLPVRFGGQLLVALVTVFWLGGVDRLPLPPPLDFETGWMAGPLTVLWLLAATNFYNFMDGIDGLAAGQAIGSAIGIAVAAWASDAVAVAILLAAGCAGFLVFNRPPARVFMGDVASTSLGFLFAGLPLLAAPPQRPLALLAVGVGLALFLLDPVETLGRLVSRGHLPGVAHRSHSYQRLAPTRGDHGRVAFGIATVGLVLSLAGAAAFKTRLLEWPAVFLALAAFAVERVLASRRSS
jgi:Fuc2NAc and GlcNAc transferase